MSIIRLQIFLPVLSIRTRQMDIPTVTLFAPFSPPGRGNHIGGTALAQVGSTVRNHTWDNDYSRRKFFRGERTSYESPPFCI